MLYTLKILECNEISTPHQMTKKRIEELGSRYFFYKQYLPVSFGIFNIGLKPGVCISLSLHFRASFTCRDSYLFFITGTIIFWFFAPQDSASARLRCSLVILWDILDPREMPWGRG